MTAHIDDYLKLRQTTLHLLTPAERIAFCSAVAAWLRDAESWIRADAAERLATAVFWESYRRDDPNAPHMTHYAHRTAWLLGEIEAAQLSHADILPAFIRHLRYRSPSGPTCLRLSAERNCSGPALPDPSGRPPMPMAAGAIPRRLSSG